MPNNLEILVIQHFRSVIPRPAVLLFPRWGGGEAVLLKQLYLRDVFRKTSKSVCTSTVVVLPDPWSPTVSISSAVETPENIDRTLVALN
jgi:hypothetical protein